MPLEAVTITWTDGTVTNVQSPETPVRPANATPAHWPRGLPIASLGWRWVFLVKPPVAWRCASRVTELAVGSGAQGAQFLAEAVERVRLVASGLDP